MSICKLLQCKAYSISIYIYVCDVYRSDSLKLTVFHLYLKKGVVHGLREVPFIIVLLRWSSGSLGGHSLEKLISYIQFVKFFLIFLAVYIAVYLFECFFKTSGNISLNPSAGERAILIKTGHGDSMILVGKWTEFVWGR